MDLTNLCKKNIALALSKVSLKPYIKHTANFPTHGDLQGIMEHTLLIYKGKMEHTWVDHKVEQCYHCRSKVIQVSQLDQGSHTSLGHLVSLPATSHNLLLKPLF
jgi:hypothetical protein